MFSRLSSEPKSRSKSPKQQRTLHRAKTDKDLRTRVITHPPKPSQYRTSFGKIHPTILTQQQDAPPKWQLNIRKHSDKNTILRQEQQLRRIQREILIQKPKIMKKRNESYVQLQEKLVNLEDQLHTLKQTMSKLTRKSKSRSRNKGKKSNSLEQKKKEDTIEEEEKHEEYIMHSDTIQKYVTQVKKSGKPFKKGKKQQIKVPESTPPLSILSLPYYLGRLRAALNEGQTCDVEQHIAQALTTINYMKKIKEPTQSDLEKLQVNIVNLKHNEGRKTIVLDLDQTLIHCNETDESGDIFLPITFPNGETIRAGINIRPYAKELLEKLAQKFEVLVFTASHSCYANVVLDYLDSKNKFITQRIFRQHCYQPVQGMYIKDLRVIANRDLKNIVLVDNAPYSYYFQLDNGIPIVPYYDDQTDCELFSLQKFLLQSILPSSDVRHTLEQSFKLSHYKFFSNLTTLIQNLYL